MNIHIATRFVQVSNYLPYVIRRLNMPSNGTIGKPSKRKQSVLVLYKKSYFHVTLQLSHRNIEETKTKSLFYFSLVNVLRLLVVDWGTRGTGHETGSSLGSSSKWFWQYSGTSMRCLFRLHQLKFMKKIIKIYNFENFRMHFLGLILDWVLKFQVEENGEANKISFMIVWFGCGGPWKMLNALYLRVTVVFQSPFIFILIIQN